MANKFNLYLSSEKSVDFPNNHAGFFQIQLPERIILDGSWLCALTELGYTLKFDKKLKETYFCSSLCDSSVVIRPSLDPEKNASVDKFPILRWIPTLRKTRSVYLAFDPSFYIPVIQQELSVIDIYIKDKTGEDVSFTEGTVSCTLHFKKQSPLYWI